MTEPLSPNEYSLAREARLLRQLIEQADNPGLKEKLVLALAKVLYQDEARAIREGDLLARDALLTYARLVVDTLSRILEEELDEDAFFRCVDRLTAEIAGVPLPGANSSADTVRLLGRR